MTKGTMPAVHLGVRGLFRQMAVAACGAWSRQIADNPGHVTCEDCRATLDFALASSEEKADD